MFKWKINFALAALLASPVAFATNGEDASDDERVVVNVYGPAGQYVYIDDRPLPAQLPAQMTLTSGQHSFVLVTQDNERILFLREINAFQEGEQVNVVLTDARGPNIRVTRIEP